MTRTTFLAATAALALALVACGGRMAESSRAEASAPAKNRQRAGVRLDCAPRFKHLFTRPSFDFAFFAERRATPQSQAFPIKFS